MSPANPNAHFSFSFGTSAAASPPGLGLKSIVRLPSDSNRSTRCAARGGKRGRRTRAARRGIHRCHGTQRLAGQKHRDGAPLVG